MQFYRSELIDHYKLIIPRQDAWQIMNMLGQLSLIHIVKSFHPILQKPFTLQIRRCEECLQKIYNLENILYQHKIYKPKTEFNQRQLFAILQMIGQKHLELKKEKSMSILDELDEEIQFFWNSHQSTKKRTEQLQQKMMFYRENIAMIKAGEKIFGIKSLGATQNYKSFKDEPSFNKQVGADYSQVFQSQQGLTIKCGILENKEQGRFSRTVFRITRGNCYIKFIQLNEIIEEPTQKQQSKVIYFLVFPAKVHNYLERKINKFISNYSQPIGQYYKFPLNSQNYFSVLRQIDDDYHETQHLLSLVKKQQQAFFNKLLGLADHQENQEMPQQFPPTEFYRIQMMKIYLLKELQIFNQLNQMDLFNNFLQAEIYIQSKEVQILQSKLTQFQKQTRQPSGHLIPIQQQKGTKKPTLFNVNSYTKSAQQIVQTYGVAEYRQANPALFTTITFPFLFGVMFGDIAHGLLLVSFGLYLVFQHDNIKKSSTPLKILLPHRYLFTLMGFFAVFCGFIYNDFLSINLNLFGSCYDLKTAQEGGIIKKQQSCIYPFGVDPVWGIAENSLNYINSLKMKISVIIGVTHMILGVLIKATNSLYFKRKIQFWFQFFPQLLFLVLVFGYMDFLIIFKWLKNWGYDNPHAPSIITTMINLPLQLGITDKQCCHGGEPMWGTIFYTSQDGLQKFILIMSLISIPIMLLVKPLYKISVLKKCRKKSIQTESSSDDNEHAEQEMVYLRQKELGENREGKQIQRQMMQNLKSQYNPSSPIQKDSNHDNLSADSDDHHQPNEIFVHQIIQTIQFVLGCISNTASYLRLWALSLAHSQLSQVFFQKVLASSIQKGYAGIILMLLAFPVFACATFGVLMCMDVMECFLHTLRLHWVQFQNKFYKGSGYLFESYNFLKKVNQQLSKNKFETAQIYKK